MDASESSVNYPPAIEDLKEGKISWIMAQSTFRVEDPRREFLAPILLWHHQQAPFKSRCKAGDVKEEPESGSNQRSKVTSWKKKWVF